MYKSCSLSSWKVANRNTNTAIFKSRMMTNFNTSNKTGTLKLRTCLEMYPPPRIFHPKNQLERPPSLKALPLAKRPQVHAGFGDLAFNGENTSYQVKKVAKSLAERLGGEISKRSFLVVIVSWTQVCSEIVQVCCCNGSDVHLTNELLHIEYDGQPNQEQNGQASHTL